MLFDIRLLLLLLKNVDDSIADDDFHIYEALVRSLTCLQWSFVIPSTPAFIGTLEVLLQILTDHAEPDLKLVMKIAQKCLRQVRDRCETMTET